GRELGALGTLLVASRNAKKVKQAKGVVKEKPKKLRRRMPGRHQCWKHFRVETTLDGTEVAVCTHCGVHRNKTNPVNMMAHIDVCPEYTKPEHASPATPTRHLKQTTIYDSEESQKAALVKASARWAACNNLALRLFNDPEMYLWAQVVRDTSCPLPNQAQVREAVIEQGDKAVVAAISE
ncbi:hypothetical protein KIPB_015380, partial [Kipferlia bialata]